MRRGRGGETVRDGAEALTISADLLTRSDSAVARWRLEGARHSAASRGGTETELANSTLKVNLGRYKMSSVDGVDDEGR